jgi:hypothetical protein
VWMPTKNSDSSAGWRGETEQTAWVATFSGHVMASLNWPTKVGAVAMWRTDWKLARLIEDYPAAHRALPDCLVLGWLRGNDPFHAVVAVDERNDSLFMVTVYKPSPEEWEDDWKTRKP